MGDLIKLGGSLLGSSKAKKANRKAGDALVGAGDKAITSLKDFFGQTEQQFSPFQEAGSTAMPQYQSAVTGEDFSGFNTSPGYQFRMDEGNRAIQGSAAARGLLHSGGTLKDIDRFSQGVASDEFGGYVSRLRDLTNLGYTATNSLASNRTGLGNNISDIIQAQGNARASQYVQNGKITANMWQSGGNALGNMVNDAAKIIGGGWG